MVDCTVNVAKERFGGTDGNVKIVASAEEAETHQIYILNLGECQGKRAINPPHVGEVIEGDDEYIEIVTSHESEDENETPTDSNGNDDNKSHIGGEDVEKPPSIFIH